MANAPEIIAASPQTYTEADLDDPSSTGVSLSDLIASISTPDTDDSETLSARITGLDSAFWLTGASQVSVGNGGDTRVWTVAADDLAGVKIHVPQNYSGAVQIQVAGVSTESDGDSTTGAFTSLGFEVTPSPEVSASDSLILAEDERTPLDIHAIPQHGDNDETLGRVFIHIGDVASAASDGKYTLYLDGTPIATAGLTSETIDGESYYVIPAEQVQDLQAQGSAHLDGELGGFRFHYEAIDAGYGSQPAASPVTERFDGGTFSLTATPVSDPVDVSIDSISATTGAATTSDEVSGDKASPDTATVTTAGTIIEVNLHVESVDHDGSEHLIRVVIDGVPEGVTVVDGAQTGASTWVLVHDGSNALPIDDVGGIDLPVRFIISQDVGTAHQEAAITMTVHSQDRGNKSEPDTDIVTDSVSWTLITELTGGSGINPPTIDRWAFIDAPATEDAPFQLSGMIDAQVSINDSSVPSIFTVSLTGVPADTVISGMFLTSVGGVPTWTASTTVQGGEDAQQALGALLDGITITAPPDSNSNNNTEEPFTFNAALSASAAGGKPEVADVDLPIEVTPASDKAEISITTSAVEEGSSAGIAVQIDVSNPRDGEHGEIVDGLLYVKLVVTGDNADGVLSLQGGEPLQAEPVSGRADVPDGDYYIVDVGTAGATVDLVYTPAAGQSLEPGSVRFEAYARTQETGAAGMETSGPATGTAEILIANNGVTVSSTPWEGAEASSASPAQAIPLNGLAVTLNDVDSETIDAIMLAGVPVGFLVYTGDDADHLSLATNAGGNGTSNTWVLSSGGDLPDHVAILPPAWWSGTLGGLELVVESGETALPTTLVQTFQVDPFVVTPVSSGLTIDPTIAFGAETSIIDLNLNATMADPVAAASSAPDESIETTTLQFVGLGAHAAFYNGGSLIDPATAAVTYDSATDTYTLVGLGQDSLDKLGFMQAASALVDQDMSTGGIQARVIAWTVDGGSDPSESQEAYLDLQLRPVSGSSGPDSFIWGGAGKAMINGGGGEDTVALRIGEDVSGSALAAGLRNIENIDLGIAGANQVQSLSLEDVFAITDGNNTLAILGDAADSVSLATGWTQGANDGSRTEYSGQVGSQTVTVHIDNLIHVSLP